MKKSTKINKNGHLDDYIYIRVGGSIKKKIVAQAEKEGSNMTIWVRQLVMRELANKAGRQPESSGA